MIVLVLFIFYYSFYYFLEWAFIFIFFNKKCKVLCHLISFSLNIFLTYYLFQLVILVLNLQFKKFQNIVYICHLMVRFYISFISMNKNVF